MNVPSAPAQIQPGTQSPGVLRIRLNRLGRVLLPVFLLLFMVWARVSTLSVTSPTYDEFEYITRGYTYNQTAVTTLNLRHPILLDTLAALPLNLLLDIQLPLEHPALAAGNFHDFARVFFWEVNESQADKMIFLARLSPLMLATLLAAFVFRWGRQRFGYGGGLLALFLCVFDPNILAHGRLVSPDVGQTFFMFVAVYAWWRYLTRPSWLRLLFSGLVLGLAQTAGFPALILYPILVLITAVSEWPVARWAGLWPGALAFLGASLLSLLVIWAVYGFTWGAVAGLPFAMPAPYHWQELGSLLTRLNRQDLAYLNGEVYRGGRTAFFPVAILLKTPLPTLIFVLLGIWRLLRQRTVRQDIGLWLLPCLYLITAVFGSLNIGYRHLIPLLPFLFVLAGGSVLLLKKQRQQLVGLGLLLWLVVTTLIVYPYFLAYFNELTGGPTGGKQWLVVSDLDWGQDLIGLRDYLAVEAPSDPIFLSYFGTTPPEHYHIPYQQLPSWPQRGLPGQTLYHPDYPLPGTYAISAANLMGARFEDAPQTFAWFAAKEPVAEIGHSILIYDVPRLLDEAAPAVNVVLSEATLAQLPASYIEQELHTNDLQPRWVTGREGLVLPAGRTVVVLGNADALAADLAERFLAKSEPLLQPNSDAVLYEVDREALFAAMPALQTEVFREGNTGLEAPLAVDMPLEFETAVSFLGYEWLAADRQPGAELKLLTYWRVTEPPTEPLTMFAHLLAADGAILAQQDGLAAQSAYWQTDDVVVQLHRLTLPESLPAAPGWVSLGWYQPETGGRIPLATTTVDHILVPLPASGY